MKCIAVVSVSFLVLFLSCGKKKELDVFPIVSEYYKTYTERKDFKKLMSFYDDNVILEDIINGDNIVGKKMLIEFLDWDNPGFQKMEKDALVIYEQIIEKNKVVTRGYFTEFQWGGTKFEAMHFLTVLTFNNSGKIIKQVDWINYPSNLIDYEKRRNSNEWIEQ
ncbi:MAG: nuclear transport factor 2 family protein [Allomuricauda sp.]